ncbi:MAG TPA: hypothetical protein VEY51_20325 [Chondromyces sp.]|nr:hypothetical protein [Chondromyces sp.]
MRVNIPEELLHPFFFSTETVTVETAQTLSQQPFFINELLLFNKEKNQVKWPWEEPAKRIEPLLTEWKTVKQALQGKFSRRERDIQGEMKAAVALFFMMLFWTNSHPVILNDWRISISEFQVKAFNVEERLHFILQRPYSYQAFVQIGEMMEEQHKQFVKFNIINKK